MAKLSTRVKLSRLHNQGFSDQKIANVTGFSKSSVGRIRRGQQSGEKIAPAVNEFFKLGKKAKANVVSGSISLPSAKPAQASKATKEKAYTAETVSPLRRAEGQVSELPKDAQVVVLVTSKRTGKSYSLFARGGIWIGQIKYNLKEAITSQYGIQYNGEGLDWDSVIDIDVQEY